MEGHWLGEGTQNGKKLVGCWETEWRDIGGVREHRMEGHWWGEGTEWRDIGWVRGHRMEGHWWGEGTQNGRTLVG